MDLGWGSDRWDGGEGCTVDTYNRHQEQLDYFLIL